MLRKREADGKPVRKYDLKTGEEVFRWWLGYDPNQIRIDDILNQEETE